MIGTSDATRKVRQLKSQPKCSLCYYDNKNMGYVIFHCNCTLMTKDDTMRKKYWISNWEPFYSNGPLSTEFILLEIVPDKIEVMAPHCGIADDPKGFKPAVLIRHEGKWSLSVC
eukprot:TRINITY_DN13208_c0_g1_i1.p1 TRINITY_DN13208_c0_g1~~TRINITY_DN13208_c0_g1_i1.p1  ORF type:complete len:114 (-),score=6.08 TRINITY_DN13208_c0_g1_i1:49-390(-)